ncbi:hypothetical protein R1flu_009606 [Riccia fluitans]|uniref:F-box domain-containing protein n=1 Tax=Riccia fluitans TaxID=41844 RepID=A0ABD1Z551_9MARC
METNSCQLEASVWGRLPLELIRAILGKLPLKSLLLFRSVCSTWKAMIDNSQVTYEGPPDKPFIFYCPEAFLYYYEPPDLQKSDEEPYLLFPNQKRCTWELHAASFAGRHNMPVQKSCLMAADGGLLCFGCFSSQFGPNVFVVYNPLTRKGRVLRPPSPVFPENLSDRLTFGEVCLVSVLTGINVDQATGNYKVVMAGIGQGMARETFVYESSIKAWRNAGSVPAAGGSWRPDRGICCAGSVYWHIVECDPSGGTTDGLLKLDLRLEKWNFVKQSVPSPVSRQALGRLHAVSHGGKVLLFRFFESEDNPENVRQIHSELQKLGSEVSLVTDTYKFSNLVDDPNVYKPVRVVSEGATLYVVYEGFAELLWRILAQDHANEWLPKFCMAERSDIGMLCGDVGKFFAFSPTLRAYV